MGQRLSLKFLPLHLVDNMPEYTYHNGSLLSNHHPSHKQALISGRVGGEKKGWKKLGRVFDKSDERRFKILNHGTVLRRVVVK